MGPEPTQEPKKKMSIVIMVISALVGYAVASILGIAFLFLLPSLILGIVVANYQMATESEDRARWVGFVNWSNLVTWVFPFMGVFTSIFSLMIAEKVQKGKKRFVILGLIGITLSIINAILGMQYYTGTGLFSA